MNNLKNKLTTYKRSIILFSLCSLLLGNEGSCFGWFRRFKSKSIKRLNEIKENNFLETTIHPHVNKKHLENQGTVVIKNNSLLKPKKEKEKYVKQKVQPDNLLLLQTSIRRYNASVQVTSNITTHESPQENKHDPYEERHDQSKTGEEKDQLADLPEGHEPIQSENDPKKSGLDLISDEQPNMLTANPSNAKEGIEKDKSAEKADQLPIKAAFQESVSNSYEDKDTNHAPASLPEVQEPIQNELNPNNLGKESKRNFPKQDKNDSIVNNQPNNSK